MVKWVKKKYVLCIIYNLITLTQALLSLGQFPSSLFSNGHNFIKYTHTSLFDIIS